MEKRKGLKIAAFIAITVSTFFYYCEKDEPPTPQSPPPSNPDTVITPFPVKEVKIVNYSFSPKRLVIMQNTSVNWTNKDSVTHSVTSFSGAFDSGDLPPANNYYLTMRQPGVYDYYCKHHKETGTVVVQ